MHTIKQLIRPISQQAIQLQHEHSDMKAHTKKHINEAGQMFSRLCTSLKWFDDRHQVRPLLKRHTRGSSIRQQENLIELEHQTTSREQQSRLHAEFNRELKEELAIARQKNRVLSEKNSLLEEQMRQNQTRQA